MEFRMGKRRIACAAVGACAAVALVLSVAVVAPAAAQTKTIVQKGDCLARCRVADFKILKNKNYGKLKISNYVTTDRYATTPNTIKTKKGNKKATFSTWTYLPISYWASGDMGNPQSVNVTPDGHYAYVTYAKPGQASEKNRTGRIVRYDLKKLAKLGANTSGTMGILRDAAQDNYRVIQGTSDLTSEEKAVLACVKFGPWFKFGHGAAFAYNPKDKRLWFTGATGEVKTNLQRINMKTLKPDLKIKFRLSKTVPMANNLAFDKKGHCYFYGYNSSSWAPIGTIKIFQGTIALKKPQKLEFHLYMQGIRYPLSENSQSMGYNPKSDRLYLVSNGTIMSVPIKKLGKLKNSDVRSTVLEGKREYEGISFDKKGRGYLLVNKQPEILTVKPGF